MEKNKITVNLLPPEFLTDELKRAKFFKIQKVGIGVILLMIFLSSLTVALRILQSQSISRIQDRITTVEQKVLNLKDKQASLVLIKNRLTTINQYLGKESKQAEIYSFLENILPASISITSMSIDKLGNVVMVATIGDTETLDNIITTLTNKETNEGKIRSVSIESLNRGRDSLYRLSLKLESQ